MKWLFLVHQIQTPRSRERVKIWRLTKKAGAVLYRNSVYVLPAGKDRLEDFQWLCQQIKDASGEASVFVSESNDEKENLVLRDLFVRAREEEYAKLLAAAERLRKRLQSLQAQQQLSKTVLTRLTKEAKQCGDLLAEIQRVDFFDAPSGKKARSTLDRIKSQLAGFAPPQEAVTTLKHYARKNFQEKIWTTRPHIHIDRLGSAWLIRRFIDPKAKFVFAPETKLPKSAIPFDIFGAEFSHHGEDCTFETLLQAFQLRDKALASIAEIVHDIDMKDQKFNRPEASGLDIVVRALANALKDDHKIFEAGSGILDALYAYFSTKKRNT
jgi:hypothetical protein